MIRNPRRCNPSGTDPPALFGSRDAPTTAMVLALSRISCELRATKTPSTHPPWLFRTAGSTGVLRGYGRRTADVSEAESERLGRFDLRLCRRRRLEGVGQHVLDATCEVEGQLFAHALRHVVDVLRV